MIICLQQLSQCLYSLSQVWEQNTALITWDISGAWLKQLRICSLYCNMDLNGPLNHITPLFFSTLLFLPGRLWAVSPIFYEFILNGVPIDPEQRLEAGSVHGCATIIYNEKLSGKLSPFLVMFSEPPDEGHVHFTKRVSNLCLLQHLQPRMKAYNRH